MNILLIGLGSIGKRHLRNLLELGYENISIVSRSGVTFDEFPQLNVYPSVEEALDRLTFNVAVICTPTSHHITTLKPLLTAKIKKIYLEKPISHSYKEIIDVLKLPSLTTQGVVVGYDLHFDPGYEKVKELLQNNTIGQVISVNAQVGQYLPDWRPHEDYKNGTSARKDAGGGVMLDLIHEFDYLYQFFGPANTIAALYKNSGALQIETEDVAEVLIEFRSGCIGTIHLDYLQQKLIRNCVITASSGTITWNIANLSVSWIDSNKNESIFSYEGFERNHRFIAIMKHFLEDSNDPRLTAFSEGLESVRMVLAAKQSAETHKFISMETFNHQASK